MRVLVADDSATIRALLDAALSAWGFEVIEAKNGDQAWTELQSPDAPSLAIVDWEMPGLDGVELCRRLRLREMQGSPYTYVLLGTGRDGRQDVIAGMDAGADDYMVKPFDEQELRVRLRAGRRIVELQTELYRMQDILRAQSRTDPLTGCLNRRGILERFLAESSLARRTGRPFGVGVLDLDHFKDVNDTHGHGTGDQVLQELVRRVSSTVRVSDCVGRIGGEEFLLLWPGLSADGVRLAGERVRESVKGGPFAVGGLVVPMTASLGVTVTSGAEAQEAVLARADQALYNAKSSGRNKVTMA